MRKLYDRFKSRFLSWLQIPEGIRQEFLLQSVQKNDFSLRIICAIIFAVESFNIARVLLWSRSGLGTRNNRIYFSMYCLLILIAVVWLILYRLLRRAPARRRWAVQCIVTGLLFLWHLGLNAYDLHRDPAAGTTVLTTAVLGLALLIHAPPVYSLIQYILSYVMFRAVMVPLLDAGDRLNLTITFAVSLAVSLAHAHHTAVVLEQHKQIAGINARLQELVQMDSLTGLLNKMAVECRAERLLHDRQHMESAAEITLFLLDLDSFKQINDRHGHPCGDHVLMQTAQAMREAFPDASALGRIGGDEFAVLYNHNMAQEQAMAMGQQMAELLSRIRWQDQNLNVRCSIGACICTAPQCSYPQLYAETDRILYRAKRAGAGRCCVRTLSTVS